MIFAVFDPSPLTVCINCSFFPFILIAPMQWYQNMQELHLQCPATGRGR